MEQQGTDEMAIIQKFDGEDWEYVGEVNLPTESLLPAVETLAENNRGIFYRAVNVRKHRGQDNIKVELAAPMVCFATINVNYENEFDERPKRVLSLNLRTS